MGRSLLASTPLDSAVLRFQLAGDKWTATDALRSDLSNFGETLDVDDDTVLAVALLGKKCVVAVRADRPGPMDVETRIASREEELTTLKVKFNGNAYLHVQGGGGSRRGWFSRLLSNPP
jgi:hypothetical protein